MEVLIKLSDAIKTLKSMAVTLVRKLPSAQPERLTDYSFEESCTECPAYDTENHRCPRFNQVIRTALKDANLEPCEDTISRQAAIDIERNATVDTNPSHFEAHQKFTQFMDDAEISSFGRWQWSNGFNTALTAVGIDLKKLPSAQPERTCVNCGRTVNNGGWYADGRTRCPIEEHYALPKDGYCHLWEERNVTDDDYPERREE